MLYLVLAVMRASFNVSELVQPEQLFPNYTRRRA